MAKYEGIRDSRGGERQQFRQALKRVLTRSSEVDVTAGLERMARKLVQAANKGEQWALLEIANRIDGKPAQTVDLNATLRPVDVSDQPMSIEQWTAAYVVDSTAEDVTEPAPVTAAIASEPSRDN